MKRSKRYRVKEEFPETSTSRSASQKEHDLAYYIHDRVELMHQVFSVLKSKEIKAMAPECVRHISSSDLQELCMEELLGISSKRLCAILDGAPPPSDTESSSESEQLETISLDSISSDEEILSQVSTKKKKHKHRSKTKPKKRKSKDVDEEKEQADRSRRAGLTVLELLELQARARAIRAQLQQEQTSAVSTGQPSESVTGNSSDDEVEIKEETAEVVEISSEDEKPNVQLLEERIEATRKETAQEASSNSKTVTKKVNDLIITVPKANTSRKIKLKRNTSTNSNNATVEKVPGNYKNTNSNSVDKGNVTCIRKPASIPQIASQLVVDVEIQNSHPKAKPANELVTSKDKNKSKDKKKKRKKDKQNDKDGSDHDEITLQLSDTEKMDLLEDLDGTKPENSSGTEDSSSDSSDEDSIKGSDGEKDPKSTNSDAQDANLGKDKVNIDNSKETKDNSESITIENGVSSELKAKEVDSENKTTSDSEDLKEKVDDVENDKAMNNELIDNIGLCDIQESNTEVLDIKSPKSQPTASIDKDNVSDCIEMEISSDTIMPLATTEIESTVNGKEILDVEISDKRDSEGQLKDVEEINDKTIPEEIISVDNELPSNSESNIVDSMTNIEVDEAKKDNSQEKSDGELSDRDSSEVEASDLKPDVVCISDDEEKKGNKKKKKEKKSKKDKKTKKKKDFRESGDQNFYSEPKDLNQLNIIEKEIVFVSEVTEEIDSNSKPNSEVINNENNEDFESTEVFTISIDTDNPKGDEVKEKEIIKQEVINTDTDFDDDVYEILELSDDSSCYEVEEISISKEPTAEEIEALSAKFDELERDRADTDKETEELDNLSWKERYLKSSKVKKVLTTANIMNAMRKKNLELKKKLQDSKKEIEFELEKKTDGVEATPTAIEDGSIEQYNTLEASTKYVDPVKEVEENIENTTKEKETVTKEMKKEAKQLLKMYKMLLKYNDMNKQKDPNKKRKKKKKSKDKDKSVSSQVVTTG